MIKRIIAVLFVITMCFSLPACVSVNLTVDGYEVPDVLDHMLDDMNPGNNRVEQIMIGFSTNDLEAAEDFAIGDIFKVKSTNTVLGELVEVSVSDTNISGTLVGNGVSEDQGFLIDGSTYISVGYLVEYETSRTNGTFYVTDIRPQ